MVWIKTAPSPVQKAREGILSPKSLIVKALTQTETPTPHWRNYQCYVSVKHTFNLKCQQCYIHLITTKNYSYTQMRIKCYVYGWYRQTRLQSEVSAMLDLITINNDSYPNENQVLCLWTHFPLIILVITKLHLKVTKFNF
jgi:hypothetical protein